MVLTSGLFLRHTGYTIRDYWRVNSHAQDF